MAKRFTKAISLFLVLIMLLQLSGITEIAAYASEVSEESTEINETTPPEIVEEDLGKREEYSKTYRMSDGTMMAAVYGEPIHYESDGAWQDIDNTLQSATDTYQIPTETASVLGTYTVDGFRAVAGDVATVHADEALAVIPGLQPIQPNEPAFEEISAPVWTNTANNFGVALPATLSENSRVHVSNKGYDLYFGIVLNQNRSAGDAALMSTEIGAATAEIMEISNESEDALLHAMENNALSGLTYSDVMPGVDIVYSVRGQTLKDTMVIESLAHIPDTVGYTIQAEGLTPTVDEDNSITFADENGETIFFLPAPYMFDSAGVMSYDIEITLHALSTGEYLLVYELDADWLEAEDRAWPVSVDPAVSPTSSQDNIEDTYVSSKKTISNQHWANDIQTGYDTTYGKQRGFIRFNTLPTLQNSDVILSATLTLVGQGVTSGQVVQITAHPVTEDWEEETITWSNQPAYEQESFDYQLMNEDNDITTSERFKWDITLAVRRWYYQDNNNLEALGNYGIALISNKENSTTNALAKFASMDDPTKIYPKLTFFYANYNGLENFWDYTTQGIGRAGMLYVNNFTGNMTVSRTDMAYSGNRMPAAITMTYNVNDRQKNIGYGYGWRLNYAQNISEQSGIIDGNSTTYYRWTDGDGTNINFYPKSGTLWKDDVGQGYTLKRNDSSTSARFVITDKAGNRLEFDSHYRLRKIVNENNTANSITITYKADNSSNLRVASVTDGAGRVYKFTYANGTTGNLTNVKYYGTGTTALETVTYGYSSDSLNKVTYADGEYVVYKNNNGRIGQIYDIVKDNGYADRIVITYKNTDGTDASVPMAVGSYTYYADETTWVKSNQFKYSLNSTKVVAFTPNTEDTDRWCVYQFNGYGNTTAVYNDMGQALYGRYAKDDDAANGLENQLTGSSRLQNTVINLLSNPGFEVASGWSITGGAQTTEQKRTGQKSMKLEWSDSENSEATEASEESEAPNISATFALEPGETYTFSGYIMTADGGTAQLKLSSGESVEYGKTITSEAGWTRSEVSMTIPDDAVGNTGLQQVTMEAVQTTKGVVYLDDFQFEQEASASRYNLVTDGDMRYSVEDENHDSYAWKDKNWGISGDGYFDLSDPTETFEGLTLNSSVNEPHGNLDSHIMVMDASTGVQKHAHQTIYIPDGAEGDEYTFGTWVHTVSAPLTNDRGVYYTEDRTTGIRLEAFNGTDDDPVATETILANTACRYWQFLSGTLTVTEPYTKIVVTLLHDYNIEESCYDGVQVFRERFGYSYEYDDDGNIEKSIGPDGNITAYAYGNGNSDVTQMTLPGGQKYSYTYNTKRQLTKSLSPENVETAYTYDSYGNVRTTTVGYSGMTTAGIQSKTTYTSDGNMTDSVTTGDRNTVTYNNNTAKSLVNSVTDPKGNVTSYTYDTMRRQIGVTQGTSTLQYAYADDRLQTITHSGATNTTYHFNYTPAGLTDSVAVGSGEGTYTLVENEYEPEIWLLESQTYGNGDVWHYTYNDYYEVESKYAVTDGTSGVEYRYVYNSEGNLVRIEQYDATITDGAVTARTLTATESYTYDNSDRMTTLTGKDADGAVLYEHAFTYDKNSNTKKFVETIGGVVFNYRYEYNKDQAATSLTYGKSNELIAYDGYGRTSTVTLNHNSNQRLRATYTYNEVTDDGTTYATNQIGTYTNTYGGSDHALSYTYDANGNILTVSTTEEGRDENGNLIPVTKTTTYEYDSLNQLVSEKNQAEGKSWVYTYDSGGNILTKTEYANATASGEGTVISYTYGDAQWGDLLTSYNGNAITYDGSGNPLSMNGWNFTWQGGRQLAGMTNGTTTLSFEYNDSGLRTTKTVGDTTHTYYYHGSTLVADITDAYGIYFHYNANGSPVGLTYDIYGETTSSAKYYYIKNLQGDIIGIMHSSGTIVASYTYDAWGNVLSADDHEDDSGLAERNPLRYRGYYYDSETELYYLQSRYYDPAVGRFLNADSYAQTYEGAIGANMFAYCGNNPTIHADTSGEIFFTVLGAVIGGIASAIDCALSGGTTEQIAKSAFAGAVSGAISGAGVDAGVAITALSGGTAVGFGLAVAGFAGAAGAVVGTGITNDWKGDPLDYVSSGVVGGLTNMISFGLAPINGEIAKGTLTEITKGIVREGFNDFTGNVVGGGIVTFGAILISKAMANS